ncbi:TetR/AcrR family transcriptional regulator [Streptomyces boluensis]|uniref:TetR family transcriptional regulator n=1 Tax=Streptomyces boluensis TaxID=1775135 RepID=A0A964XNX5_9ACTN|nr:TetR/AcrR family transcriptional regulator [Streptomyces boluensis]NBE54232.1 TetR family transcriptional regulator [Streptomyces boluensis]
MSPRRAPGSGEPTFTERARREQLVACTIDLIASRGYPATSLAAVAGEAGLSKAAVLYHFRSKDNLTRAAFTHVVERFAAYVHERVAAAPDPRAAVVAYVRAMVGYQQAHRNHVRVITETLLDDAGGTRLKTPGGHDTGGRVDALAELLASGQQAGVFREFAPHTVALAVGGAIDGVVAAWLTHPELDLDAAADELVEFTLRAVDR